jgi:hypothetical protein
VAARGPAALDDFFAAALKLVAGQLAGWRERWRAGALAAAELTGAHLDAMSGGVPDHLAAGGLWRIEPPGGPPGYGMCGRLTTYPAARAAQIG